MELTRTSGPLFCVVAPAIKHWPLLTLIGNQGMLRHAAVTDGAWLLLIFKVAQRGNDPGRARLAAVCTFNHNNASKLHPEQVQRHELQTERSALTKLVTHYSAACVCLWSGLHSHCPNSDWPKKKKKKRRLGVLIKIDQPKASDTPRRAAAVFCDRYSSRYADDSRVSQWIWFHSGGARGGRGLFSLCTVLTLSLFSVHLSLFFLLLIHGSHLPWVGPIAPSVSQQSKQRKANSPHYFPVSSPPPCRSSLLFDSR